MTHNFSLESARIDFLDFSKPQESLPDNMKEYNIWLGYYHLGQGHHPDTKTLEVVQELLSLNAAAELKLESFEINRW